MEIRIKNSRILLIMFLTGAFLVSIRAEDKTFAKLEAVPHSEVRISDVFWAPRIETNWKVSIRTAFGECEKAGNIGNFAVASGLTPGGHRGSHAYDSDVYKIIEGAAYSLKIHPDPELEAYVDRLIGTIATAQQKDGYLNTYFTIGSPGPRWQMPPTEHETYCAGHLFEAAVAYNQATGKRTILNTAVRLADHIGSVFGPGKRYAAPGHQEIELALVRLFRTTGKKAYFDLARFFLDERGFAHGDAHRPLTPKESDLQNRVDPKDPRSVWRTRRYNQDHKPVTEQFEAVGHAVRAGYMYSAMADVASIAGDEGIGRALDRLWEDVAGNKLYITGGIGTARYRDEGFGDPYDLPNDEAYCETCAAAANILWNHRMNLLRGDAKYVDVLELALYNGFLSGVSLSGDRFFYENPLASRGEDRRDAWSDPACCPSNVVRIIPQVGNFVYARDGGGIYVNLYVESVADIPWKDAHVRLVQTTFYPWEGKVRILVEPASPDEFTLNVRIPGWAGDGPIGSDLYAFAGGLSAESTGARIMVNGKSLGDLNMRNGYARIRRSWKKGDIIEVDLPMPVRRVRANPKVEADRGRVALMRGPIVYCLESADNPFDVLSLALPGDSVLEREHRASLLGGVTIIRGRGLAGGGVPVEFAAVPYYAWANREAGAMTIWVKEK